MAALLSEISSYGAALDATSRRGKKKRAMIVVGTSLSLRKDHFTYPGVCEKCEERRELQTFTARQFFMLNYLPIFPTGARQRVFHYCPNCTVWRQAPLKDWEASKRDEIAAAMEALKQSPHSEEAAIKAIETAMGFFDRELLPALANDLESRFGSNAKVLGKLGEALSFLGFPDRAEKAFRASLALQDDPAVRDKYGLHLIYEKRPAEALALLARPISQEDAAQKSPEDAQENMGRLARFLLLAESFQAVGDHEGALAVFNEMRVALPSLDMDKKFSKWRRLSEKKRGSQKKISKPHLVRGRTKIFCLQDAMFKFIFVMIVLLMALSLLTALLGG
jgi:tetratricopeptide (TPR) repeat protein